MLNRKNVLFYNFLGVSCVKINKNNFLKVSKVLLILNYFKLIAANLYRLVYELCLKESNIYTYSNDETQFASVIRFLQEFCNQASLCLSYILQNIFCEEVTQCLTNLRYLKYNDFFEKKFCKICKQLKFFIWGYFITCNLFYAVFQYSTPWNFKLLWIFSFHIQGFILAFFYILIIIEESLVLELKQFENELEFCFAASDLENMKLKFWNISRNFKTFLKGFELQVATFIVFNAINIAFAVRNIILDFSFNNNNNIFQFFNLSQAINLKYDLLMTLYMIFDIFYQVLSIQVTFITYGEQLKEQKKKISEILFNHHLHSQSSEFKSFVILSILENIHN